MRASSFLSYTVVACILICCSQKEPVATVPNWSAGQQYYLTHINKSIELLDTLKVIGARHQYSKQAFIDARREFKRAETYASYLNPETGHMTNGPPLPVFKEDNLRVLYPIGLQKMEESIYGDEYDSLKFAREAEITAGLMRQLEKGISKRELTAERFFIATQQQLLRIISLGISGFDTPMSGLGVEETSVSLKSLEDVYSLTIGDLIKEKRDSLDKSFHHSITEAINFVNSNTDFASFDRYTFISKHMNPICRTWAAIRKTSELWGGNEYYAFNFDTPTFFESNSFNVNFFAPNVNKNPTQQQIALGKKLFNEPRLSMEGKLACVSCHAPEKAYSDQLAKSKDRAGNPLDRNTPTLINSTFQRKFFWDGRAANLLDQISLVFSNKKEFNANVHQLSPEILKDSSYQRQLKEAFGPTAGKNNAEVIRAISSYISTLNGFDSKFDRNMRGQETNFTDLEIKGMNLFMGKALCATCHFVPLTNGTVPPFFDEMETEIIGVPSTVQNKKLDDDLGIYWKYNVEIHKGRFKTPTIRNIELTAPYMHNGVYTSLEQVVDFYNKGGGGGLGFDLPFLTLPFDELNLNDEEKAAVVAFMKTLTDPIEDKY